MVGESHPGLYFASQSQVRAASWKGVLWLSSESKGCGEEPRKSALPASPLPSGWQVAELGLEPRPDFQQELQVSAVPGGHVAGTPVGWATRSRVALGKAGNSGAFVLPAGGHYSDFSRHW